MSASTITSAHVAAWRMSRQGLLRRAGKEDWLDTVRRIGGLHAQVMSAAELSVWARADGVSPDDVKRALWEDRTLVKTWAMRGTLHLLPADELPTTVAALRETVSTFYRKPSWLNVHGITLEQLDAVIEGIRRSLGEEPLTREQLADALVAHTGQEKLRELLQSGWGSLLKPAAHEGALLFGPSQGQNITFVRPDRWLPRWTSPSVSPEEAVRGAVRRYLSVYGPATYEDFGRWWGVDVSKAKRLFRSLDDELVSVRVDGREGWMLRDDAPSLEAASVPDGTVRLLPHFDPYTVSMSHRTQHVLAEPYKPLVYRNQGWIYPVVLVGTRMAGIWETEKKRGQIELKVEWFEPPKGKQAAATRAGLEEEASRLAAFFDADIVMRG